MSTTHQRDHSKYSASGSHRWLNCAASVALEEQSPPSPDNPFSLEGTQAHAVLEVLFKLRELSPLWSAFNYVQLNERDPMVRFGLDMVDTVRTIFHGLPGAELLVEKRIYNTSIHPEMFGTVDAAIVQEFGELHVFDYKYGKSLVKAEKNTQMIQYALGLAEKFDWNFSTVSMHIYQPRVGLDAHSVWTIPLEDLKGFWLPVFKSGVARTLAESPRAFAGHHCFWCRAKSICPLKEENKTTKAFEIFGAQPLEDEHGEKESSKENKKESGQKSKSRKKNSDNLEAIFG